MQSLTDIPAVRVRDLVVAFGDHVTDAAMLAWAGHGVAVANAHAAALAAALRHVTGKDEIVVGTQVAGREEIELEPIVAAESACDHVGRRAIERVVGRSHVQRAHRFELAVVARQLTQPSIAIEVDAAVAGPHAGQSVLRNE